MVTNAEVSKFGAGTRNEIKMELFQFWGILFTRPTVVDPKYLLEN